MPTNVPHGELPAGSTDHAPDPSGTSRRRFIGYVLAAPTLAVAAQAASAAVAPTSAAAAPVPSAPQPFDVYDLSDLLTDSCRPTNHLLTLTLDEDGVAHFALPRAEVGQGITTSVAQVIAEELDSPVHKVRVTLADARPELLFNQITGGSNTLHALWETLRQLGAVARTQLANAAAARWGVDVADVRTRDGLVLGPAGQRLGYGELASLAATASPFAIPVTLKDPSEFTVIGRRIGRVDARAAVTGTKKFAMDLDVPNALPTMVCHAPTLHGTPAALLNEAEIAKMPGVTDVGIISTGVAVRARTFGQCIDAVRAMKVRWNAGSVDGYDNDKVISELKAAEIPLPPPVPGMEVLEHTFTFHFRSGSPMETNNAIADVRADRAEVWSSLKNPIIAKQSFAEQLGLPLENVLVHVTEGGGSFGRHLYHDAAQEAVESSKLFGKPVRLMWHRTEDSRHGRTHPAAFARVRAQLANGAVTSFDTRHTSVASDVTHGFGEVITGKYMGEFESPTGPEPINGNEGIAQTVFHLTTSTPYNFGALSSLLNEIYSHDTFATSPVRNVYSPDTATVRELMVDQIGLKLGKDPLEMRREFLREERMLAVLEQVAERGKWGRKMAPGTAQGIAIHNEYKSRVVCLMEIDTRPETVNRKVRNAYTGPRVTKVVIGADLGQVINPSGAEAQLMGGAIDGIAQALSASLHLENGLPLEGSWDDYRYARQWNAPYEVDAFVVPSTVATPGGAGELGCGVAQAAAACAYARATGELPTEFPLNFRKPLGFAVKAKSPAYPQSPIDGRRFAR